MQWAQTGVYATKHLSAPALTQAPQQEPPDSVRLGWAQIARLRRRACCMRAGRLSSPRHHSGQESPPSEASSNGRRLALLERQTGSFPTLFPFLFLAVVSTTTNSPVDSDPVPSSSHWARRPTGLFGGGGSPPLPAAAAGEKSERGGMLTAYNAG